MIGGLVKLQGAYFRWLSIGVIFLLAIYMEAGAYMNWDTNWYLVSTGWWLGGVKLYSQIREVNPPLMFYLIIPPVLIAKYFVLNKIMVMKAYTFGVALVSVIICSKIIKRARALSDTQMNLILLVISIGFVLIPVNSSVFSERSHFMVMLSLPYIILGTSNISERQDLSKGKRFFIGLFSAVGLAIKPYYLIIPVLITVVHCVKHKSFRPVLISQNIAILLFCVFYLLYSYTFHYAYFSEIIPKALLVYGAYKRSIFVLIIDVLPFMPFFIVGVYVAFSDSKNHVNMFLVTLVMSCIAGFFIYFVQAKGWTYQQYPLRFYLWFFLGSVSIVLFNNWKDKKERLLIILSITAMLAFVAPNMVKFTKEGPYTITSAKALTRYFLCPVNHQSYQAFSASVSLVFSLLNNTNAQAANHTPALWLLPEAVDMLSKQSITNFQRKQFERILSASRNANVADFLRVKPQVVFIDARINKPYFHGVQFSYLDFFKEDKRFSELWKKYKYVGETMGVKVYRRKGC